MWHCLRLSDGFSNLQSVAVCSSKSNCLLAQENLREEQTNKPQVITAIESVHCAIKTKIPEGLSSVSLLRSH
jgi:hypothetical protein